MAQTYVKNPIYVLAVKYEGDVDSANNIASDFEDSFQGRITFSPDQGMLFFLRTQQGAEVLIEPNNFVIQGSDGEFFTLPEDIFFTQYQIKPKGL
jgi:hypothetical protein